VTALSAANMHPQCLVWLSTEFLIAHFDKDRG
jgi:hypothetical protein